MLLRTLHRGSLSLALLCGVLFATARADPFKDIDSTLHNWDGPRHILLRSNFEDPVSSPLIQDLIEQFLSAGFKVTLAAAQSPAGDGLVADIRDGADATTLILSRGPQMTVLSLHRWRQDGRPEAMWQPAPLPENSPDLHSDRGVGSGNQALPGNVPSANPWGSLPAGPVELEGNPRRLALLGQSGDQVRLAILEDDGLRMTSLSAAGHVDSVRFGLSETTSRGLHVDSADLDGDGRTEVVGVWAEDIQGVYDGVDSKLHAWIFQVGDTKWARLTGELGAYARAIGNTAYQQSRSAHVPFDGPVLALRATNGAIGTLAHPVPWGHRGLFDLTPLDTTQGLTWDSKRRLKLVFLESGRDCPNGLLMEDLGLFKGPHIAVRLEAPEYRSGFEKEDRVTEKRFQLPPRLVVAGGGTAYTISRKRGMGLPLLGSPRGRDAVVRILADGGALRLERPFAPVEAFILDFALFPTTADHRPAVILLLNDAEDGSGAAHLLVQHAN